MTIPPSTPANADLTVISIGTSCQTSWQVRHHTKSSRAHYFDWVLTPTEVLIDLLGRPEEEWAGGAKEVARHVKAVFDRSTGLHHPHDFLDGEGKVVITDENQAAARSKYRFLARRFFEAMASDPEPLFVWQNIQRDLPLYLKEGETHDSVLGMDDGRRSRLIERLTALRGGKPFRLLIVTLGETSIREAEPGVFLATLPTPGENWYGCTESWGGLYARLAAIRSSRPAPALARPQTAVGAGGRPEEGLPPPAAPLRAVRARQEKVNIGLRGYFGHGNFGDEVFCDTWKQLFFDQNVLIDRYNFSLPRKTIIGGGDILFLDGRPCSNFNASLLHNDFYVYGVGIPLAPAVTSDGDGPPRFRDEAMRMAELLGKAKAIACRDARSVEILRSLGVASTLVPDLAFSYRCPIPEITKFQPGKVCGLVVFSYEVFEIGKAIALAQALLDLDFSITVIPVVDGRNAFTDTHVCRKIAAELPAGKVYLCDPNMPIEHKWSVIRGLDMLVSLKMHPGLAALREGVPTIAISDQAKVRELFKLYGLEEFVFPQVGLEVDRVAEAAARLSRRLPETSSSIRATTRKLEAESDASVQAFVQAVLNG